MEPAVQVWGRSMIDPGFVFYNLSMNYPRSKLRGIGNRTAHSHMDLSNLYGHDRMERLSALPSVWKQATGYSTRLLNKTLRCSRT